MSKNLSELSGRKGLRDNLFEQMGKAAVANNGTVSAEELERLHDEFLIGKANVYGAVSFYDFLRPENQGKKVYVCNGSACLCAGTQKGLHEKLEKHFDASEIGEMCCLGRCHENAAFNIGGYNYSGKAIDSIVELKKNNLPAIGADTYSVGQKGRAVIISDFPGIESYYEVWRRILTDNTDNAKDKLLTELQTSGLRGRGGAGFPIHIKLDGCRKAVSNQKYIVCNADEGDPGAYSDRYIMEKQAHALLLGMMIAGFITDASAGVLYIRAEYPESVDVMAEEIRKLHEAKLLGENILGSGFHFDFKIIKAQGAYICGEETALLNSIEGKRPEVRTRPPYPVQQGLFNKPTVVNNVETLACIPFVIKNGGAAFATIGKGRSTGTKLVSLDSAFHKPGIYEVEMGTPLRVVIDELGGGFKKKIKAMHIGGPLGGLVPVAKIDDLSLDFESFAQNGFLLGHASVVCIPEDFPIINYLEHLFQFTAHESCGKCFPCRLGSTRGYELLNKARTTDYKIDRNLMNDLLDTMEAGSLCALGGGLPLPVKNALKYFDSELKNHLSN